MTRLPGTVALAIALLACAIMVFEISLLRVVSFAIGHPFSFGSWANPVH